MGNYQHKSKDQFYRRLIEHILCPTLSWNTQCSKSIFLKPWRLLTFHKGPSVQRWSSSFLNLALCRQYRGLCTDTIRTWLRHESLIGKNWMGNLRGLGMWFRQFSSLEIIPTCQKTNLSHPHREFVRSQLKVRKLALIGWPAHFNSSTINQSNSENFMIIEWVLVQNLAE